VNHEASPAKLADKLSTRIGVMTRIVVYSRINVANAGHLLLDFLLKGRSNNNQSWRNTCSLAPIQQTYSPRLPSATHHQYKIRLSSSNGGGARCHIAGPAVLVQTLTGKPFTSLDYFKTGLRREKFDLG
jgi:hypothetical protein